MGAQACTLKDWAALASALLWPFVLIFALILFRTTLEKWVTGITNAEVMGVKLTRLAETTKITATALIETDDAFDKIQPLLDWNRVGAEVTRWAREHNAPNPADMGINNFRRFLFDTGLPGGRDIKLETNKDGTLKYQ
jgi:hypothetical protein